MIMRGKKKKKKTLGSWQLQVQLREVAPSTSLARLPDAVRHFPELPDPLCLRPMSSFVACSLTGGRVPRRRVQAPSPQRDVGLNGKEPTLSDSAAAVIRAMKRKSPRMKSFTVARFLREADLLLETDGAAGKMRDDRKKSFPSF